LGADAGQRFEVGATSEDIGQVRQQFIETGLIVSNSVENFEGIHRSTN
jgi:hypothetical protein